MLGSGHRLLAFVTTLVALQSCMSAGSRTTATTPAPAERRVARERPARNIVPLPPDSGAASSEYVYAEELPEAIHKVPPKFPTSCEGAIEGTVMVQARVLKDGTVGETKVVKSVPCLDEAAVESVRQWRFKPAMTRGAPVEVWVAIPVSFSETKPDR